MTRGIIAHQAPNRQPPKPRRLGIPLQALVLGLTLGGVGVAQASLPYPAYDTYQARFYERLGAECLKRAGPMPQCFSLLETSLTFDAKAPQVHFTLGRYYTALGDLKKATGAFLRAVELAPELSPAYIALGDVYLMRGEVEDARRQYQVVAERHPEQGLPRYKLATAHAAEAEEADALKELAAAIERGFKDAASLRADPAWRNVLGSPALEAQLAPLEGKESP